jgi:RNA polymerase sigma factor (sigma-70 family)
MKDYNINNYNRYKQDIKANQPEGKSWDEYTRDELIIKFTPLAENIARKFSTSQAASGVMTVTDMIQEGHIGLIKAVDKIIWPTIFEAENPERRLKSFLAKRIKGAIRRAIDNNRGSMRIPEHKLNQIRKDFDNSKKAVDMYFNSIFTSIDDVEYQVMQIPDNSSEINNETLNRLLLKLTRKYLNDKEYDVIRMSYGLDCDKLPATEIANHLGIKGSSSYVRVSQLKSQALNKLKQSITHSQVADYL